MIWDSTCVSDGVATIRGIVCVVQNLIKPIPALIILIAFGMVVYSGIKMMTAGADAKAYGSAVSTFTYSIIGLVLLSGIWLLLILIERFTGAPVTKFEFPVLNP